MSDAVNEISPQGKAEAEAELEELREVKRPRIVAAIKAAREEGDLSENAEYHAAKDEQGHLEARIRMLEDLLANAEVVEAPTGGKARVGSRISFRDKDSGEEKEVTLVHRLEASMSEGKLSAESPVGRALMGASKGDAVKFETPNGAKSLEILSVWVINLRSAREGARKRGQTKGARRMQVGAGRTLGLGIAALAVSLGFAAGAEAAKLPEFAVTSISSPPSTGEPGDTFTALGVVENKGKKSGKATVRISLRPDNVPENGPIPLGMTETAKVKKGDFEEFGVPSEIPEYIEDGTYYMVACATPAKGSGCLVADDRSR